MGNFRAINKVSMVDVNSIKGFSIIEIPAMTNMPQGNGQDYNPYMSQAMTKYAVEFLVGSAKMKSDLFSSLDEVKLYLKKLLNVKI